MKIRKALSAAKIAANRKNAKNSSGPKSVQGKRFASRNAMKYGIFAPDMLLPAESRMQFDQERKDAFTDFAPVGFRERVKVQIYFANYWCLQRVYRAVAGETNKSISEFDPRAEIATCEHTLPYRQAVADLKKLEEIEEEISLQGSVSAENLDWLQRLSYGDAVRDFVQLIQLAQEHDNREDSCPGREVPPAAEGQTPTKAMSAATSPEDGGFVADLLLSGLQSLKAVILREILHHGDYLPQRVEAKRKALQVPQEGVLNRLMRYERHLLNNMTNTENQLERLQRLRRGDEVPPPSARVT